jgi:oligoribonuclease (3'-5' exoribonuclease)
MRRDEQMSLKRTILCFDKEEISQEEILEHVKHYFNLAQEGLDMVNNDNPAARTYLRKINETLKEEYHYYKRSRVQTFMRKNIISSKYYSFITEAFAKQSSVNSYRMLGSNLGDIRYYARHYFHSFIE